jgi:hypothetical protein
MWPVETTPVLMPLLLSVRGRAGAQSGVLTTDRSLDPLGGGESMRLKSEKGESLLNEASGTYRRSCCYGHPLRLNRSDIRTVDPPRNGRSLFELGSAVFYPTREAERSQKGLSAHRGPLSYPALGCV